MIRQVNRNLFLFSVGVFDADERSVTTDAFGITFGDDFIIAAIDVKQLVFESGRTGVQY